MKLVKPAVTFVLTLACAAFASLTILACLVFGGVSSLVIGLATVALAGLGLGLAVVATYEASK